MRIDIAFAMLAVGAVFGIATDFVYVVVALAAIWGVALVIDYRRYRRRVRRREEVRHIIGAEEWWGRR